MDGGRRFCPSANGALYSLGPDDYGDPAVHRARVGAVAPLLLFLAAGLSASAATLVYEVDLFPDTAVAYHVDFEVDHPGVLSLRAEWPAARILSFRLEAAVGTFSDRRSGPSPQHWSVTVGPEAIRDGEPWRLWIRGLASPGGGRGRLTIEIPEPERWTEPLAARVPSPAPTEREPVTAVPVVPPDSPVEWTRFERSAVTFAALLDDDGASGDACRWQEELSSYLGERLQALADEGAAPERRTRQALGRVADAVRTVEAMRSSADPILAGPVPKDDRHRQAWLVARRDRMLGLETMLDEVRQELRRGHAPELGEEDWPVRMISCVTACQRHFEESVRLGPERATNLDLASAQWERLLAAADALERLSALDEASRR
jgi:hypothetical protein